MWKYLIGFSGSPLVVESGKTSKSREKNVFTINTPLDNDLNRHLRDNCNPEDKCMLQANNKNTILLCWICSKPTIIKTSKRHPVSMVLMSSTKFNPFVPKAPFLYPLKTSENLRVFWCFQGVQKGCTGKKWFNLNAVSRFIGFCQIWTHFANW